MARCHETATIRLLGNGRKIFHEPRNRAARTWIADHRLGVDRCRAAGEAPGAYGIRSPEDGDLARVFSRRGLDWADRVPCIVEALLSLRVKSATLDGEAVVCNGKGISDFESLRSAMARREASWAFLYGFDLLELDGADLRRQPWEARREALVGLRAGDGIRLSEHMEGPRRPGNVPACVRDGARRDRLEAARRPLPLGTVAGLD